MVRQAPRGPTRSPAIRSPALPHRNEVAQLLERARADDLAFAQLIDGREGLLRPGVDDLLGGDRADTRQRIELRGRGAR